MNDTKRSERGEAQIKAQAQGQFGPRAERYVTSHVHARGWSLARLVELVTPQPDWTALDIATGGGHTALAFAPHVARVVALDLTRDMLLAARRHAVERETADLTYVQAEAAFLPFPQATFHLVTCRIAAHHFPDVPAFVRQVARALKPGGHFALTDNVTPSDHDTARYLNAYERLRDPSHHWEYSLDDWHVFFHDAGLEVTHSEARRVYHDFDEWAERMSVSPANQTRLRAMLLQAPSGAHQALAPRHVGGRLEFNLQEAIVVGHRPTR